MAAAGRAAGPARAAPAPSAALRAAQSAFVWALSLAIAARGRYLASAEACRALQRRVAAALSAALPAGLRPAALRLAPPPAAPAAVAPPAVLAVVLPSPADEAACGRGPPAAAIEEALTACCRMLRWAAGHATRHVVLYEPSGALKAAAGRLADALSSSCLEDDSSSAASSSSSPGFRFVLGSGRGGPPQSLQRPPPGVERERCGPPPSASASLLRQRRKTVDPAPAAAHDGAPAGPAANGHADGPSPPAGPAGRQRWQGGGADGDDVILVEILSEADSYADLLAAARAGGAAAGGHGRAATDADPCSCGRRAASGDPLTASTSAPSTGAACACSLRPQPPGPSAVEALDAHLRRQGASVEDVSLLWVLAPAPCVAGFPPWRLRLGEIHHLAARPRALTVAAMARSLRRYLRTEQRYGT